MWDGLVEKFEKKYGVTSMQRVKALLAETPRHRKHRNPLQLGAQYILPGLPERMVIDIGIYREYRIARDRFYQNHSSIRSEIMTYLEQTGRPEAHSGFSNLGGEKWRVVRLSRVGREDAVVTKCFPVTVSHLRECKDILYPVAGVTFSLLEPGANIAPHSDRTNVFIHLHQSVVAASECGLKVGDIEIEFQEKHSYLFDPSFRHEAWNRGSSNRINLILPVWHPETTIAEREALKDVFVELRGVLGR